MSAIRLARGFTGRKFVIKFEGCYHGHADALLVKAGSGHCDAGHSRVGRRAGRDGHAHAGAALQRPARRWRRRLRGIRVQIACIIVEPVVGNAGTIVPAAGYLQGLRRT